MLRELGLNLSGHLFPHFKKLISTLHNDCEDRPRVYTCLVGPRTKVGIWEVVGIVTGLEGQIQIDTLYKIEMACVGLIEKRGFQDTLGEGMNSCLCVSV